MPPDFKIMVFIVITLGQDLGLSEKVAGLAYVAVSRVRNLSDLLIEPTSHDRLVAVQNSSNFIYRCTEEKRLDRLDQETYVKHS